MYAFELTLCHMPKRQYNINNNANVGKHFLLFIIEIRIVCNSICHKTSQHLLLLAKLGSYSKKNEEIIWKNIIKSF